MPDCSSKRNGARTFTLVVMLLCTGQRLIKKKMELGKYT